MLGFSKANKLISYKKMKRMTKQALVDAIKAIDPTETINTWNYKHIVLMDILNYHLNDNLWRDKT